MPDDRQATCFDHNICRPPHHNFIDGLVRMLQHLHGDDTKIVRTTQQPSIHPPIHQSIQSFRVHIFLSLAAQHNTRPQKIMLPPTLRLHNGNRARSPAAGMCTISTEPLYRSQHQHPSDLDYWLAYDMMYATTGVIFPPNSINQSVRTRYPCAHVVLENHNTRPYRLGLSMNRVINTYSCNVDITRHN